MPNTDKTELDLLATAKTLRDAAELTAKASQNWDNFEAICFDALQFTRAAAHDEVASP